MVPNVVLELDSHGFERTVAGISRGRRFVERSVMVGDLDTDIGLAVDTLLVDTDIDRFSAELLVRQDIELPFALCLRVRADRQVDSLGGVLFSASVVRESTGGIEPPFGVRIR